MMGEMTGLASRYRGFESFPCASLRISTPDRPRSSYSSRNSLGYPGAGSPSKGVMAVGCGMVKYDPPPRSIMPW